MMNEELVNLRCDCRAQSIYMVDQSPNDQYIVCGFMKLYGYNTLSCVMCLNLYGIV